MQINLFTRKEEQFDYTSSLELNNYQNTNNNTYTQLQRNRPTRTIEIMIMSNAIMLHLYQRNTDDTL